MRIEGTLRSEGAANEVNEAANKNANKKVEKTKTQNPEDQYYIKYDPKTQNYDYKNKNNYNSDGTPKKVQ